MSKSTPNYQVSIKADVEADDDITAALEGYKAIMNASLEKTVTLQVRNAAGVVNDVTLDVEEADEYAGFSPLTGFRG
jgi:hypothetical protein